MLVLLDNTVMSNFSSEFVKVTYLSGLRQAHITVDLMAMPCR